MNKLKRWAGLVPALAAAALHAADAPPVKQVPTLEPPAYTVTDRPRSVIFKRSVMTVSNDKFGEIATGYFCSGGAPLTMTSNVVNALGARFASVGRRELQRLGFTDSSEERSAFARSDSVHSDYEIAATLRATQAWLCTDGARSTKGAIWLQARWEVFAPKQQRVVLTVTTEGSFASEAKLERTIDQFFEAAFLSAMKNALADKEMAARLRADPGQGGAATAEARDALAIARPMEANDAPDAEFKAHRSAVVTVFGGTGSGSGFYIDGAGGHLLTNHHVVGDSKYVKVRLATGRDLVGEVLRSDALRDVALVKTEAVALQALALARTTPAVGDEVFVIGSPYGERFASTLTKGVLSGSTKVDDQRYWQSDVKVLPGSSGGPLLMRDGAVVGLVRGGVGPWAGATIDLFVPIDEAIAKLGIVFRR
jgi:S1-C subfamily serine protease